MAKERGVKATHKFLAGRRGLDLDLGDNDEGTFSRYENVPPLIGLALSFGTPRVTLAELQTVYGLEDLYDMLEVYLVNASNARVAAKRRERK